MDTLRIEEIGKKAFLYTDVLEDMAAICSEPEDEVADDPLDDIRVLSKRPGPEERPSKQGDVDTENGDLAEEDDYEYVDEARSILKEAHADIFEGEKAAVALDGAEQPVMPEQPVVEEDPVVAEHDWEYYDQFIVRTTARCHNVVFNGEKVGQLQPVTSGAGYRCAMLCYKHRGGQRCSRMRSWRPASGECVDHADRVLVRWLLDGLDTASAAEHKTLPRY